MSDFDKEAEREKLRKQFERDRRKRAATQRMSELLLRGATMTNRHCPECGDPIFRYEGQEFCPTCDSDSAEAEVDVDVDEGSAEGESTDDRGSRQDSAISAESTEPIEPTEPTGSTDESPSEPPTGEAVAATDAERAPSGTDRLEDGAARTGVPSPSRVEGDRMDSTADTLLATIDRLASRAGAAEDPRRAKEYLEAAAMAAETLERLTRP